MAEYRLYYATNRNHQGSDRWHPSAYGSKFSQDGMENLRFGVVTVKADARKVKKYLSEDLGRGGTGNGEKLAGYLAEKTRSARIDAFEERIDSDIAQAAQKRIKLGLLVMFKDLQKTMQAASDVLLYIHGFNVSWYDAVGAALALQLMLEHSPVRDPAQGLVVTLFTWPSDGLALPWVSYKSDRSEAAGSGAAVGRGMLKVRDFLAGLRDRSPRGRGPAELCGQDIHLLCHSMGNYLLQHALQRVDDYTPGSALPRLFEHVFLCAPDVDDDALESGNPLGRVHEIARSVSVYHNRGDVAMYISDYSKGHPDRLGGTGAARPALLHNKVHQIDCAPVVSGIVEHSYYLSGHTNEDIRASIDGRPHEDVNRRRERSTQLRNVWTLVP